MLIHCHQRQEITFLSGCNFRLLNSFLLRQHGLVNSWSHRLVSCHILHSSCKLPSGNSLLSSCQVLLSICLSSLNNFWAQQLPPPAQQLPQPAQQLPLPAQQLPLPAQQLQAITAPWPRRQRMEQALQPVAHDDLGLGTDTVAQAATHPLSAPFAELITSPLHHLRPPPALQDVRGAWAYIHKPGVGTIPIAPPSA